ncbi:MAG TPA: hypothetical protein VF194_08055 [Ferrovibrio sp.]|uniref:hypothetical protein n=1 Tax=Ferrovibrio sp. TaxID=1917215 RepID=UPI002ED3E23D
MGAGWKLYMFLQDNYRDQHGFAAFLGSNFFVVNMKGNAVAGQSQIVVLETRNMVREYPIIGELTNELMLIAKPEDRYAPPLASYVLPTTPYRDVEASLHALPGLTLPAGGDTTIAISAQLSGCSLCYRPATRGVPDVKIIHIQPTGLRAAPPVGEKDSVKLQNILQERHACFAGDLNRPTKVYGGKQTGDSRANIILLRRDGKWTLFAQLYAPASNTVAGVDVVPLYE